MGNSLLAENQDAGQAQGVQKRQGFAGAKGKSAGIAAQQEQSHNGHKLYRKVPPGIGMAEHQGKQKGSEQNRQGHDEAYVGGGGKVKGQVTGDIGPCAAEGGRQPKGPGHLPQLRKEPAAKEKGKQKKGKRKPGGQKPQRRNAIVGHFGQGIADPVDQALDQDKRNIKGFS